MIADKYMPIKPYILNRAKDYYNETFKDKVVLGVMARGCEFYNYHPQFGNHTIETWVSSIRDIRKEHPEINAIFLVTEDNDYIPIICREFPDTVYLNVFRRTNETINFMVNTPLWPSMNSPRPEHCKRLGEECLVQTLLLGMCDYMCVKQCGTSSGGIFFGTENLKNVYYAS
jgi:hypothetical protein